MTASAPQSASILNDGQRAALDLRRDMIVSAGAGAGKTQVLGLRVLALLESGRARVEEIVALTFTEKAANEMRERVQRLLLARVEQLEASRVTRLGSRVHQAPRKPRDAGLGTQDAGLAFLRQAVSEFHRNRISTVHGFCSRLLREHAWEAGLEPRAPVLDERRQAWARDEAVRAVLFRSNLAEDSELGAALARLSTSFTLRELREALTDLLRERHVAVPALGRAAQAWTDPDAELARRLELFDQLTREALAPVIAALQSLPFKAAEKAKAGDALAIRILQLKEILDSRTQKEVGTGQGARDTGHELAAMLLTKSSKPRAPGGSKANWKHDPRAIEAAKHAWSHAAAAMADALEAGPLTFDPAHERRSGETARDLALLFERLMEAYTEARGGGLDVLDLELRAIALLRDQPDVRAELNRRLRYILVDEFQDTNPTQAELFDLLREGDAAPGRFFAVGDAKQSIYGFRGSDVSIFNRALKEVPARNSASGVDQEPVQPAWGLECQDTRERRAGMVLLEDNYRTVAPVLELGNRVFQRVFASDNPQPWDARPQDMHAKTSREADTPMPVELYFLHAKERDDDSDARKDDEAELIAQRVHGLLEEGFALSDIAILVRRGTRNQFYRDAFARHNLPLVVVGEAGLLETQEAMDCLNLLRVLADPGDDVAVLGLLRSPFARLTDRYLTELALRNRKGPLMDRVRMDETRPVDATALLDLYNRLRLRVGRDAPALLLSEALAETGYALAVGCSFDAQQRLANVERFLEVVRATEQEQPSLALLVAELRERVEAGDTETQGVPEAGIEGVRLMTVHKSKGLEFPVVIVPDLAAQPMGGGGGILRDWPEEPDRPLGLWLRVNEGDEIGDWRPDLYAALAARAAAMRAQAEEKRGLYVAWTRAERRLILFGTVKDNFGNTSWAHQLANALSIAEWGAAAKEPALEVRWLREVQRDEPVSHQQPIAQARQALEAGELALPELLDISLCTTPKAETAQSTQTLPTYHDPDAAEFGTLVHAALERRMRGANVELGALDARFTAAPEHVQRAMAALAARPRAVRELPEFGLVTPDGNRRLDLLRDLGNGVYEIVDYKTDRVHGDHAAHAEREHGEQLRGYGNALREYLKAQGRAPKEIRLLVCFTGPEDLRPEDRLVEIAPYR
jgi:ATP-dependent helicase/nuclease subunit A